MSHLSIVISGEVDHGKSTFIGRMIFDTGSFPDDRIKELTGQGQKNAFAHFLDSFKEEREQEMTVDTAQATVKFGNNEYTIIDSPGHKEFMRSMITGASYANAAVVICDVREGLREQTRRHANVLSLLGIKKIIVVINKMDTVSYQQAAFDELKRVLTGFFSSIKIEPVAFIPVSALCGENIVKPSDSMGWYHGPCALEAFSLLSSDPGVVKEGVLFSIQDTYSFKNRTMAVGRVEEGQLRCNDELHLLPSEKKVRISGIKRFLEKDHAAHKGDCVGVLLRERAGMLRGDVLCDDQGMPSLTQDIIVYLLVFAKEINTAGMFLLRCGNQEVRAQIRQLQERRDSSSLEEIDKNASALNYLDTAKALMHLSTSIAVKSVDESEALSRFVLFQDNKMCAAGVILRH